MPKKFKTIKFRCQNAECNRIYTVKHSKIIPCPFCGKEENFRSKFRDPKKDYEKIPKVSTVIIQPTLNRYTPEELKFLIKEIIPKDRSPEMHQKRVEVVKILRENKGLNWTKIGKIIHRDHSSAMNLYYPKKFKNKKTSAGIFV